MRSLIRLTTFMFGVFVLTGFGTVTLPSVANAGDITKSCGGVNQNKCSTSKATYRGKVNKSKPKGAFFDPRKGGEWWKCPSNRPRRTAYAVTDKRACATKRIFGEKLSRAEYKGKTKNKKPSGAFFDPRKGGEYWSCPRGYIRNLNPVTHKSACTIAPKYVCDSGNIAMGKKCYKRGACGKNLQRPCQLVERIPSCNKGLAEDFIANKCIKQSVAGCLTVVRTIKALDTIGKGTEKAAKTAFKALGLQIPSSKNKKNDGKKRVSKAKNKYKNKKQKDKLLTDITKSIEPFKHVVPELKKTAANMSKSAKKLRRLFTDEGFCTASKKQREQAFAKIIPRPNIKLKKKAHILDGLLIKNAHAANANDEHFYMSYDFSVSAGAVLGVSLGLSFVTDYRGNGGAYFSIGPEVVTNVAAGGGFGLGFYPKVNAGSFAGWGWGIAVSAGPPTKVVSGSVSVFIDENFKEVQGFGFGVGVGAGVSPVDLTFGAAHAWKL